MKAAELKAFESVASAAAPEARDAINRLLAKVRGLEQEAKEQHCTGCGDASSSVLCRDCITDEFD